mmetsp:Transcript_34292/g.25373  ORF Transcript_34292/g.25373 Transcript_34292/m.25373 type:complete len:83 (+) Transcript_34292:868-1116(+)
MADTSFRLICSGSGGGFGESDMKFSTVAKFGADLSFEVFPDTGVAYETPFNLTVKSSTMTLFSCQFGYIESSGRILSLTAAA